MSSRRPATPRRSAPRRRCSTPTPPRPEGRDLAAWQRAAGGARAGSAALEGGQVVGVEAVDRLGEAALLAQQAQLLPLGEQLGVVVQGPAVELGQLGQDRKSTRLNSSHVRISYAVFCL